jgi:hypothetical protein
MKKAKLDLEKLKVITRQSVEELTEEEFSKCYRLNHRSEGLMQEWLRGKECKYITMIMDNKNTLLGWCTLIPYTTRNSMLRSEKRAWGAFYVRRKCRRRGLGTFLFKCALANAKKLKIDRLTVEPPSDYERYTPGELFFKKIDPDNKHTRPRLS